jgi:hypothetical protein
MNQISYLDRAITGLRQLGIELSKQQENTPVLPLLEKIAKYDNTKIMGIAATLQQSSVFNAAVRDQIRGMDISTRFTDIANSFDSIREDAVQMAGWMEDGRLDFKEKIQLNWIKLRRGSIPDRFSKIRDTYLEVAKSANDQIQTESMILEAYRDFRMALKSAEVDAQEVLAIAVTQLELRKEQLKVATAAIDSITPEVDATQRTRLELSRDEALRAVQDEDKSYQIIKDIADDLKTSYNTAELVFARLQQTSNVKERLYQRSVTFFSTNEVVFTGLSASFTSMAGLSEATNAMEAMKEGMNKGLEAMATTGSQQLEASLRSGYGSTLQTSSVKALADAVVQFQANSMTLIEELRIESTKTANEIEAATADGKKRFVALLQKGV